MAKATRPKPKPKPKPVHKAAGEGKTPHDLHQVKQAWQSGKGFATQKIGK